MWQRALNAENASVNCKRKRVYIILPRNDDKQTGNDEKAEKPWCAPPLIPAESQNNIFAASLFRSGRIIIMTSLI